MTRRRLATEPCEPTKGSVCIDHEQLQSLTPANGSVAVSPLHAQLSLKCCVFLPSPRHLSFFLGQRSLDNQQPITNNQGEARLVLDPVSAPLVELLSPSSHLFTLSRHKWKITIGILLTTIHKQQKH